MNQATFADAHKLDNAKESAFFIDCLGESMPAILHHGATDNVATTNAPATNVPANTAKVGLLLIVGGPQYRVGSHRQFVLLARSLAAQGYSCLRFDYRGMGDADGEIRTFEHVQDDIRAAIDAFAQAEPSLTHIVLWGLCDAASAALMYAPQDDRIKGLVLLNPWVQQQQAQAQVVLKHYYWKRLRSKDFWRKLLSGGVAIFGALGGLKDNVKKAHSSTGGAQDLCSRLRTAWQMFRGNALVILSGDDLVAQEFIRATAQPTEWQTILRSDAVKRVDMPEANHTFSRQEWRDQVSEHTLDFLRSLEQEQNDPNQVDQDKSWP